jgi:hypothetical protein
MLLRSLPLTSVWDTKYLRLPARSWNTLVIQMENVPHVEHPTVQKEPARKAMKNVSPFL